MLYDEPTSALDSITERSVNEVLHASETDRTSIVVAHKLRLVQDADLILVMENGRLVEQGTHAELLCMGNSTYSRMWAQQRHGDENYYNDAGPPLWCEYVPNDPVVADQRVEAAEDALALQSLGNQDGWLW